MMKPAFFAKLILAISLLLISPSLEAKKGNHYQYDLALCAIFQNEAPYLAEWIEFHRIVGVQHFYLYNNSSTDEFKQVLAPYIQNGIVELINWPYPCSNIREWGQTQINAYNAALKKTKQKVKWLIFTDIDEYLFPTTAAKIQDELKPFENFGGISVNWLMFGSSSLQSIPSGQLQIEALTWRALDDYRYNFNAKSIVRPDRVVKCLNPHCFAYKRPYFCVNTAGTPYTTITASTVVVDKLRINHYWTRDETYFNHYKIPRYKIWGEPIHNGAEILYNLQQVEDPTILRFVPHLKQRIF